MNPFDLSAYDYPLDPELIAQAPLERRDASRLLVVHRDGGKIEHRSFADLPEYLDARDLLVRNDTAVLKARLLGHRLLPDGSVGGKIEMLLLEKRADGSWEGAFHSAAKQLPGVRFRIPTPDGGSVVGELVQGARESKSGTVVARFDRDPVEAGAGELPLPHYIRRPGRGDVQRPSPDDDARSGDAERYQTVYAREPGSAAAPTAGLHFTDALLATLAARGVRVADVTLHVGLGTFRPVKSDDIRDHVMHEERWFVPAATAEALNRHRAENRGRVVAVGTTAVRTLESAFDAEAGGVRAGSGRTDIFLYPGGRAIRAVDRLITNFHLPKSTLLMLVSAFAGRELIAEAYREALKERYRFFSYGDAMLIL